MCVPEQPDAYVVGVPAFLLISERMGAVALTNAQLIVLRDDIAADPAFAGLPHNSDGAWAVAAAYNLQAVPNFYVWKDSVETNVIMGNGFDWTRIDNLTVGKSRIWDFMTRLGVLNPSQANVRAGILATFGTAADLAMRLAIFGHCQRLATRIQKLFSTGAGTAVTEQGIGPATAAVDSISYQDVLEAWRL